MEGNFDKALRYVLEHEGGYVNHPKDPGGATNRGVTQKVYDAYRVKLGVEKRSVKDISPEEVSAIYRRQYWNAVKGDELPSGVDYAVFDFAVNSGVFRATRYMQQVASVSDDGVIGPMTLQAVRSLKPSEFIDALCDRRMTFLRKLPTFTVFGLGWTRRVHGVRAAAKDMAA